MSSKHTISKYPQVLLYILATSSTPNTTPFFAPASPFQISAVFRGEIAIINNLKGKPHPQRRERNDALSLLSSLHLLFLISLPLLTYLNMYQQPSQTTLIYITLPSL
jgi:hypothetical protein